VPTDRRPALARAQGAWRAFRTAECDYGAGGGGTGHSSAVIACAADMNRARTEALERDLERWVD